MHAMSRRQFFRWTGAGAAALLLADLLDAAEGEGGGGVTKYPFKLPKLPYAYDALEPSIDARTMEIHYSKHHAAYVAGLNAALKDKPDLQKKTLQQLIRGLKELPTAVQTAVRNSGGGHLNHTLFWGWMAKDGGKPDGDLAKAIDSAFGSFDKFQMLFSKAGATRFGSGWAWLVVNKGKLEVVSTPNQDTPYSTGSTPVLGLDVWEHAYYLKYQNRRPDYIKAWWNVVNWKDVASRYAKATAKK
jgi:Fe-Mn family superoxide dismutase